MEVHFQSDSMRFSGRAQSPALWHGHPFFIITMPQKSTGFFPLIPDLQEEHNGVSFRYRNISGDRMVGNC